MPNEYSAQIRKAALMLDELNASCVVLNDVAYHTSEQLGIAPLICWLGKSPEILRGSFVADKTVGRAAAFLMIYGGVTAVYAGILSEGARSLFETHGIYVEYRNLVPVILNRTKTERCPMETLCDTIHSPEQAYNKLIKIIKKC